MSDDNKFPGPPPPDDFSKTTPNIGFGEKDDAPVDWDKTNYNIPRQPAGDDWGKTVTNIKPIDTEKQDYGKTMYPGSKSNAPQTPDWGMTAANVNVNPADIGSAPEDFGAPAGGYDKTTPYFRLPEAERAKYQDLPPTPTEKADQEKREQAAKGGIPVWVWAGAAIIAMMMFAIMVLAFVYFFVLRESQFEVSVRNAPPGSKIRVDEDQWGTTREDGSFRLTNLKPGQRRISIVHPNYTCREEIVNGRAGETPEPITARCTQVEVQPGENCESFSPGEFEKAERCYNRALDALPDPFTVEDLVRALNILIINFETNKFDIPDDRLAALQKGAGFIKRLPPDVVLDVSGHTDNVGSDATNQPLSENRAKAVKAKLVTFGVRSDALQTRGYGSTKPRFDNNTDQGRFLNRRIEYFIVKK